MKYYIYGKNVNLLIMSFVFIYLSLFSGMDLLGCEHTICLTDKYSDGWQWNGDQNSVTVYVNGSAVGTYTMNDGEGPGPKCFTFEASSGDEITTSFDHNDNYGSENGYSITDGGGNEIVTRGDGMSIPADVSSGDGVGGYCNCPANEHDESGSCVPDSKKVDCNPITVPDPNGEMITDQVDISWSAGSGWSNPADCDWECKAGFQRHGDVCYPDQKEVPCNSVATPELAENIVTNVTVSYKGAGEYDAPPDCAVQCVSGAHMDGGSCVCDTDFHKEGNSCEGNSKKAPCSDVAPANATSNVVDVDLNWNEGTSSWETPPDCTWNCHFGYYGDGTHCDDTQCGDSIVAGAEECDGDANCKADCTFNFYCGDGIVNGMEECDEGKETLNDGSGAVKCRDIDSKYLKGYVGCGSDCKYLSDPDSVCEYCGNGEIENTEGCDGGSKACSVLAVENSMYSDFISGTANCNDNCNWNISDCILGKVKRDQVIAVRDFKFNTGTKEDISNIRGNIVDTTSYMFVDNDVHTHIKKMIDSSDNGTGKTGGWFFNLPANTMLIGSPVYYKSKFGDSRIYFVTYTKAKVEKHLSETCDDVSSPPEPGWAYLWEVNALNSEPFQEHLGFKQDRILAYLGRGIPSPPQIVLDEKNGRNTLVFSKLPCFDENCKDPIGIPVGSSDNKPLHDKRASGELEQDGERDPCKKDTITGKIDNEKSPYIEVNLEPCDDDGKGDTPQILWWKVQ